MDFGTLKLRILGVLGRAALDMAYDVARADLNNKLRVRAMLTTATITRTSGDLPIPDDFIELETIINTATGETPAPVNFETLQAASECSGLMFCLNGGSFIVSHDVEQITITYYATLTELVNDTDTNVGLNDATIDAYAYSVLLAHARLIRDQEGVQAWGLEADRAITNANRRDGAEMWKGPVVRRTIGRTIV